MEGSQVREVEAVQPPYPHLARGRAVMHHEAQCSHARVTAEVDHAPEGIESNALVECVVQRDD